MPRSHSDRAALRGYRALLMAGILVLAMTTGAAAAPATAVTPELLEKVQASGVVLVIVTLRVPEGASPAAIATVKRSVLGEIAFTRHRVVRELAGLPQIALEASDDTLRLLAVSPNVLHVEESIPRPPLR